jgi:hypothetical protein
MPIQATPTSKYGRKTNVTCDITNCKRPACGTKGLSLRLFRKSRIGMSGHDRTRYVLPLVMKSVQPNRHHNIHFRIVSLRPAPPPVRSAFRDLPWQHLIVPTHRAWPFEPHVGLAIDGYVQGKYWYAQFRGLRDVRGPCILRQGCDCGMRAMDKPSVRLGRALQRSWVM